MLSLIEQQLYMIPFHSFLYFFLVLLGETYIDVCGYTNFSSIISVQIVLALVSVFTLLVVACSQNTGMAGDPSTVHMNDDQFVQSKSLLTLEHIGPARLAQLIGPVLAVVTSDIGTILVVILVAWLWPEMRRLGTLRETPQAE